MAQFVKGQSGNVLGKPVGAKNKVKQSLAEFVLLFTEEKTDEVRKAFAELSPKEKITAWLQMLSYTLPKKATVEHTKQLALPEEISALTFEQLTQIEAIIKGNQPSYQIGN